MNCKQDTNWVSISFGANVCSQECARKAWHDYFVAERNTDLLPQTFRKQNADKTEVVGGFEYMFYVQHNLAVGCRWVSGKEPLVILQFTTTVYGTKRIYGLSAVRTYADFRQLHTFLGGEPLSEEPWSIDSL